MIKKVLFALSLTVMAIMVGCEFKETVNTAKLSAAEKVGEATEKFLLKEFQGEQYAGYACADEAKEVGAKMQANVEKLLKVEQSPVTKSLAGDIVKLTCKLAVDKALPMLIDDIAGEKYRCSSIAISGHVSSLGSKLCDGIDF